MDKKLSQVCHEPGASVGHLTSIIHTAEILHLACHIEQSLRILSRRVQASPAFSITDQNEITAALRYVHGLQEATKSLHYWAKGQLLPIKDVIDEGA